MAEVNTEVVISKSLPLETDAREVTTNLATFINSVTRKMHNARICKVVVTLDTAPYTTYNFVIKRR